MEALKNFSLDTGGRAFIAGLFSVTTCYMFISQLPIPPELMLINGVVVVDYFRSKQQERMSGVDQKLPPVFIPGDK